MKKSENYSKATLKKKYQYLKVIEKDVLKIEKNRRQLMKITEKDTSNLEEMEIEMIWA